MGRSRAGTRALALLGSVLTGSKLAGAQGLPPSCIPPAPAPPPPGAAPPAPAPLPPMSGYFTQYRWEVMNPSTNTRMKFPTCIDVSPVPLVSPIQAPGFQITRTGFMPYQSPRLPFMPPYMANPTCPQNPSPLPGFIPFMMHPTRNTALTYLNGAPAFYLGNLDFNLCLYGLQDISLGTVAHPMNPLNPQALPVGLMLQCKGPEENHTMIVKRFTGNCYGLSAGAPLNTFKLHLKDQDAFLRGDCTPVGNSGFIKFTGLKEVQSPLTDGTSQVTMTILGSNLMNCSAYYATGANANTPTVSPTSKPWNWTMIRQQYQDVHGVGLDRRLPQWKKWWVPTLDDQRPVSKSG